MLAASLSQPEEYCKRYSTLATQRMRSQCITYYLVRRQLIDLIWRGVHTLCYVSQLNPFADCRVLLSTKWKKKIQVSRILVEAMP